MKKFILTAITIIATVSAFAQTGKFVTTKEGITDYVVVEVPNSDVKKLYDKTIEWVSVTYKNPTEVLKSKIENDKVIFNGMVALSGGPNYLDYTVIVSVKDGKYKFEVSEIYIVGAAIGRYNYKQNLSQYYKGDGTPKSERLSNTINDVEVILDGLNLSLYNYINSNVNTNNNW